jgi:hypothetical protein
MIDKILASSRSPGAFVRRYVADNPTAAATSRRTRTLPRGSGEVERVYLRAGGATWARSARPHRGPSLVSYIGHGGIAVWASENVWNNTDIASLAPPPRYHVLFTMNCLNGYFHYPSLNSLAEQFLKAEGRGAVAAFSPTGLALDEPAHLYHELLIGQIASGSHERLGTPARRSGRLRRCRSHAGALVHPSPLGRSRDEPPVIPADPR